MSKIKNQKSFFKQGFTLLEILVVIVIVTILSFISYASFANLHKNRILEKEAGVVVSVLEEARSLSISSKDASQYGVFFEVGGNTIALFSGANYSPESQDNKVYILDELVVISGVNLVGGETDTVVFQRLTGATDQHGTIVIARTQDSEDNITIAVYPTGVIERLE